METTPTPKLHINAEYALEDVPCPNGINRWTFKCRYAGGFLFDHVQVSNVVSIPHGDEGRVTKLDDMLYDAETGERLGRATFRQAHASDAAGDTGIILIDANGNVVAEGTWEARQSGVRKVYTR